MACSQLGNLCMDLISAILVITVCAVALSVWWCHSLILLSALLSNPEHSRPFGRDVSQAGFVFYHLPHLPSPSSINKLMNTAFSGLAVFAIMSILNLFTACIYLGQVMTYIHGHCLGSRYRFRPQTFRIRWGASLPFVLGSLNLLVSCLPISSPSNCSYRSNLGLPIVSNLILARVMLIVH